MAKDKEKSKKSTKSELLDWLKAIIIALIIGGIIRVFLFSPIIVDGPSMAPTLEDGDQMIVNRFIYDVSEPERFDIVVFHASDQRDFIKRVVGLPGDHVAVSDDVLYINGEPVREPFLAEQKQALGPNETLTNDFTLEETTGEYQTVPEGHVFVLGDNRRNSTDSRIFGVIPIDEIVGKASFIYWPLDRIQTTGE